MSETKTPRLTEPQRYILGQAVETAYYNRKWDGEKRDENAPRVWSSKWHKGANAAIPTIKALLRAKMLKPTREQAFLLTREGIRVGEEECFERTGVNPREEAKAQREASEKAEAEKRLAIDRIAEPFAGIRVKRSVRYGQRKKLRGLDDVIRLHLSRGGEVTFSAEELAEIGLQVK